MNPAWITQRLALKGPAHRIGMDAETACAEVVPLEALDAVRQAADVVASARRACAQRLRRTRERERRWRQRLRAQSLERAADEAADLQCQALADAARISAALKEARDELLTASEHLMVEIAHQAAHRLLLDLPSEQPPRSSARLLHEAWRAMRGEGQALLRVHPDDLDPLKDIAHRADWTLLPDAALERGGCVLSHPAGSLHARYVDNVQALLGALPGAEPLHSPRPCQADPSTPSEEPST